jgi:purine-binding chemotaxis protein CheW
VAAGTGGVTLTVRAGGQSFSILGRVVAEILRPLPLTRVPLAPACLLGVVNRRGQVLPVLSLGGQPAPETAMTRIVVVDDGVALGLLVDEVLAFGAAGPDEAVDIASMVAAEFNGLGRLTSGVVATASPDQAAMPQVVADELALVMLRLAGQDYAVRLDAVAEIIALPSCVTTLPGTDGAMLGMVEHRGSVLPLLSLRVLLTLGADGFHRAKARIVVTTLAGRQVGLVVDGVTAIRPVSRQTIAPVPPVLTRGDAEAKIEAICRLDGGRRLVALLSMDRLLDAETMARLQAQPVSAARLDAESTDSRREQFVVVRMGADEYGLPVAAVADVVRHPGSLARVPYAPGFVAGVMNLRGKIVPVLDQRHRFGIDGADPAAASGARRVVILRIGAHQAGFVVDAATALIAVLPSEVQDAPALATTGSRIFDRIATRPGAGAILLVNPRTLLDDAERELLAGLTHRPASVTAA